MRGLLHHEFLAVLDVDALGQSATYHLATQVIDGSLILKLRT